MGKKSLFLMGKKSLFLMGKKSLFMDPELWVLLHEKLPRELSWSESERELASAREISHESSFSLKKLRKTSSYYSKFQSVGSRDSYWKVVQIYIK